MSCHYTVNNRLILAALCGVYSILPVLSDNWLVCRDDNYVHVVYVSEFTFLSLGCTCHSGQLLIHPEVVLQCYRRQCLGL